ncbi:MAG: alkaline phosphatase D family protein [Hyphomonadaceae bacterium]
MNDLTRRNMLALSGGGAMLGACQTGGKIAAPYAGAVSFDHGVASGDVLSDRAIVWTRVTPADTSQTGSVTVIWQIFEDAGLTREVQAGAVQTSSARDYTVKVDVTGLQPARDYYYAFSVFTDAGIVASPSGRTRTLAASGTTPIRAAFVSCSNFPFGQFNVYDALSRQDDLDVIIHLGDYIYEYGRDGYGGEVGKALGREHEPAGEITSLADYRTRHAQYKSDRALQRAHAAAPWICTWDDHESANNSYRTGAQNHTSPREGSWTSRKQQAVQAYLEWMPVRDPVQGAARSALWRRFDFGDLASLMCLETRLTGRSEEISWNARLTGVANDQIGQVARKTLQDVNDPTRTMLGGQQEAWLADQLESSSNEGKVWQVLANQTIMARAAFPNFPEKIPAAQIEKIVENAGSNGPIVKRLIGMSAFGLPHNLDAWDGFPAARERLYEAAKSANASLVTLTGDTHTGWANGLKDAEGEPRGVEFGCTSVTSPGIGEFVSGVEDLGQMYVDANDEVNWFDPDGNGFTLLDISAEAVRAEFYKVSSIVDRNYSLSRVAGFETRVNETGRLRRI